MPRKINMLDAKIRFNDIFMREVGFDITENDYLFDLENYSIIQIKEKFIKYCDYEYPVLRHNEIDMNLIENARLTELLALPFLHRYCYRKGIEFHSISQFFNDETNKGYFTLTYIENGETKNISSDEFTNESVRILNLISKLRKTTHMYDFNDLDIEIRPKK